MSSEVTTYSRDFYISFAIPACEPSALTDFAPSFDRSRKYYFVQISTGESTWDVPTMAAPQVPTPGATPAQENPYPAPMDGEGTRGMGGQEGDRGLGVSGYQMKYTKAYRLAK